MNLESRTWRWLKKVVPIGDRAIMAAPLVGLVSGIGAILFHLMCLVITHVALTIPVGYTQGGPANEAEFEDIFPAAATAHQHAPATDVTSSTHADSQIGSETGDATGSGEQPEIGPAAGVVNLVIKRPWLLLIIPTLGGLVSGFIVYRFAPEAEGHGTDSAIDAYHNKRGVIRGRVPIVKMLSSAITLGTGGSGGREGPIAQIGAGFGSFLATRLKLSAQERRVLMAAGLGAGIGAIFHAPLAGAIFAAEVLYRGPDFEAESIIPAFIATTVAYCVFSLAFGFHTLFEVQLVTFDDPLILIPLAALAGVAALAAWGYVKIFYGLTAAFKKLPIPQWTRPALGAFLTGAFALVAFYSVAGKGPQAQYDVLSVLSFGYGYLQRILTGGSEALVIVLLIVGVGKIITTSLTIGSGGSGGVFGPSMVIGAAIGGVVGLTFHQINSDWVSAEDVTIFVILGMASFFAAAAKTPVSTLIMVSELTGSYKLLLPAMWVCALSYLISGRWSLYREQVYSRLESPAHRGDFIIDILQGLTVHDALPSMKREFVASPLDMPMSDMAKLITNTRQTAFPVIDSEGKYYGLFGLNDVRQFLYDTPLADLAVAQDLANTTASPLTLQTDLSTAITQFSDGVYEELPVVDQEQPDKVLGLLRRQDVIAAYSARLLKMRTDVPLTDTPAVPPTS